MAKKEKLREEFRPTLFVTDIHQVREEDYDPEYEYKYVIFTHRHDRNKVERYIKMGWEVVETTSNTKDDRDFTPNSKDGDSLRPKPCIQNTIDGHEQVLMRCLKTQRAENELSKKAYNDNLHVRNIEKRGGKVTRDGNNIKTVDAEINEGNI